MRLQWFPYAEPHPALPPPHARHCGSAVLHACRSPSLPQLLSSSSPPPSLSPSLSLPSSSLSSLLFPLLPSHLPSPLLPYPLLFSPLLTDRFIRQHTATLPPPYIIQAQDIWSGLQCNPHQCPRLSFSLCSPPFLLPHSLSSLSPPAFSLPIPFSLSISPSPSVSLHPLSLPFPCLSLCLSLFVSPSLPSPSYSHALFQSLPFIHTHVHQIGRAHV